MAPPPSDERFDAWFADTRALLILRGLGPTATLAIAEQAWTAGVTMLEVPCQTPADERALALVCRAAAERKLIVGAGTVVTTARVELVARAGAAYIVCPGLDADVVRAALDAGLAVLPGVATPTEIQAAANLGLGWVKVFPASVLGPEWIKAMRGPFPDLRMVATGGINATNASSFLDAGARVVSFGSSAVRDGVGPLIPYAVGR